MNINCDIYKEGDLPKFQVGEEVSLNGAQYIIIAVYDKHIYNRLDHEYTLGKEGYTFTYLNIAESELMYIVSVI